MEPPRRGILLVNLGSPDSPAIPDVRQYLSQFLMDPRVIDSPWIIRRFVVSALIVPRRAAKTAAAYASIWTDSGSPLVSISRQVTELLRRSIDTPVALGMTYGNPSIDSALDELISQGVADILLMPMFPHYAMSTYESVVVAVRHVMQRKRRDAHLEILPPFYDQPEYISALVAVARPYLDRGFDHLLFSYHGLPERHLRKSDPTRQHCLSSRHCCQTPSPAHETCYRHQVLATTQAFVRQAGVPATMYSVAFQSRLGRDPWLQPYTDAAIMQLARAGKKRLLVICPSFVADCLETIEEIGDDAKSEFLKNGGEYFELIPCLNSHPRWIGALASWTH